MKCAYLGGATFVVVLILKMKHTVTFAVKVSFFFPRIV